MNPDRSLHASAWLTILLQTVGSVDLPTGNSSGTTVRKMPMPGRYLAVVIVWSILDLFADAGYGRAAAAFGWVVALGAGIFGAAGTRLVEVFQWVSNTTNQSDVSLTTDNSNNQNLNA